MKKTLYTETTINSDGELSEKKWITRQAQDTESFIKMYLEDISKLHSLTNAEHRILINLLKYIEFNTNEFFLNSDRRKEIAQISKAKVSTLNVAISRMMKKSILIKQGSNMYMVNPKLFFNGTEMSRKKLFELHISYTICETC